MSQDRTITVARLLQLIAAFRARLVERQNKGGRDVLWAAAVEIGGLTCRGLLVELIPDGFRLAFAAKARGQAEMARLLGQLDSLGAKVICEHRDGGSLHLVLAPEPIAERAQIAASPA